MYATLQAFRLKSLAGPLIAVALLSAFTPAGAAKRAHNAPDAQDSSTPAPAAGTVAPSPAVDLVTSWVIASHDNDGLPFIVIDKVGAEVFIFDADGKLLGKTTALVGAAKGDGSAPGIGHRDLSQISPSQRTTPAGRFIATYGTGKGNPSVLWVDYADSISLHAVVTSNKKEHRLQRLKSTSPRDKRITYGCINVPTAFYKKVVRPVFASTRGVVYILPEDKSLKEVFPAAPFPG